METNARKPIAYISGGMTGIKNKNRFMFEKAAKQLRKLGYHVISPLELDDADTQYKTREEYLMRDIPYVFQADFLVLLPDWFKSQGALLEIINAATVGKPIYTLAEMLGRKRYGIDTNKNS